MSLGDFTVEEGQRVKQSAHRLFRAIPKYSYLEHLEEIQDILLFIDAAIRVAPHKPTSTTPPPVGVQTGDRSISNGQER